MKILTSFLSFHIMMVLFLSCNKNPESDIENKIPVANSGPDQTFYWPKENIPLNGTGIDADGKIIMYRWFKLSGPNHTKNQIEDPSSPNTTVTFLEPGLHEFLFSVTDNNYGQARDTVNIQVIDTLTTPGKEYVFTDLRWSNDVNEFSGRITNGTSVVRNDLFYNPTRAMDVYIQLENSVSWQSLSRSSPTGRGYSPWSGGLYIYNIFQSPADDMQGKKLSVKIKFL